MANNHGIVVGNVSDKKHHTHTHVYVHADKHTEDTAVVEVDGENPRRSSSMDCLSDPDSYTWPRLSSTNQVRERHIQTYIHT